MSVEADSFHPSRAVLHKAAQWLALLHSEHATPDDWQALARWRAQDAAHEQAWQRAERLSLTLGALPTSIGMPVLARTRRTNRRAALRVLALAGTTPVAAWLGWRHAPWQEWMAEHRTATGERRSVVLADGTQVMLNTASAFDAAFDAQLRRVRLRAGEVLITTAPDASRPFVVETPQGRLRALGTRFAVRLDGTDAAATAHVAVTEGAVEVTPRHGPPRVLHAGEQARFSAQAVQPPAPLGGHALAWTEGVLYADGMRLADFAAELSRYRPGLVRCDPAVADLRISGAFQLNDTEYILTMLRETLPVEVVLRTRYWVTLVPA